MKAISLMKKIDHLLYREISKLEENDSYQKISDSFSALEENAQRAIKLALVFLVIAIPLFFLYLFSSSNSELRKEAELKRDLITKSNTLIKSKVDIKRSSRQHFGNEFVESQNEIKSKISGMLNIAGVDASKVKISNIEISPEINLITKIKADVKFDNLDNKDFFNFIKNLATRLKIRVDEVSVQKNMSSKLLDGLFTIHYLSKASPIDE